MKAARGGTQGVKDILKARSSKRSQRMDLIQRVCMANATWSAGLWVITKQHATKLRGVQRELMLVHFREPRVMGESAESYHRRRRRNLKAHCLEHSIPDLDIVALKRTYRFMGHVARRCEWAPEHLVSRVLLWNCHQRALRNTVHGRVQGHVIHNRIHWEGQMSQFFYLKHNLHWMQVATNKDAWKKWERDWIAFRLGEQLTANGVF